MKNFVITPSALNKFAILICTFIVGIISTSLVSTLIAARYGDARWVLLTVSALQSMLAFILPAFIAAMLCSHTSSSYLGTDRAPGWNAIVGIILIFVLATPCLNAIVDWNANITLPESMSILEQSMRRSEQAAAVITDIILNDNSVWGLISGVLIVGILTGFAEESFFRGGIQKGMTSSKVNPHIAVWATALIFSAMHFQFFGFVPRLLLGALFGYIYYYSGSLWLSAIAHAFNNSVVVVSTWLINNGYIQINPDTLGVEGPDTAIYIVASAAASIIFLYIFFKKFISNGCTETRNKRTRDNRRH